MTDAALILFGLVLGVYVGAYFAGRGWRQWRQEDAELILALKAERAQLKRALQEKVGGAVVDMRERKP